MIATRTQDQVKAPVTFRAFLKNNNFENDVLVDTSDGVKKCSGIKRLGKYTLVVRWVQNRGYKVCAWDDNDHGFNMGTFFKTLSMAFLSFEINLSLMVKRLGTERAKQTGLDGFFNSLRPMDLSSRVKAMA